MASTGTTLHKMSRALRADKIVKPRIYQTQQYGVYDCPKIAKHPYDWQPQTIKNILRNIVYLGHLVCNRATTKSFKNRKLIQLPEEQWIVTKNTHAPIIDQDAFDIAQKMVPVRKKPTISGAPQEFVGLLVCADCGKRMTYTQRKNRTAIGSYACGLFRTRGREYCTCHYITYENLYTLVIQDIRKHVKNAKLDTDNLLEQLAETSNIKNRKALENSQKELSKSTKRIAELDTIIKRLYEDNIIGKLTDDRFTILSSDYEAEQKDLKNKINAINNQIQSFTINKNNSERFADIIKKYTEIEKLTPAILNELIDKIVIHEATYTHEKRKHGCRENRKFRTQQIDIHYNFVGEIL